MMRPMATHRMIAALAVAGVLVTIAVATPAAQRRNRGDNSVHGAPVATNTIAQAPEKYYGKLVTVSAAVETVLSKTVFVVDQRRVAGPKEVKPAGSPLLVIAPYLTGDVEQNRYFLVRGEVVKLTADALATAAAGYTPDLSPEALARYDGQPVLVASSIIDGQYAELTDGPPAPAASPRPAGAAAN